jgi:hypothetical protein
VADKVAVIYDLKANERIVKVKREHWALIRSWYRQRGLKAPKMAIFSDMGYIADGRVAGFLAIGNSSVAFIEGIISDPNTVPSLRKKSLMKLCGFLTDTALTLGYNTVIGVTKSASIVKVGEGLGFKELKGYKIIALTVEEDDVS